MMLRKILLALLVVALSGQVHSDPDTEIKAALRTAPHREELTRLYGAEQNRLLWTVNGAATRQTQALVRALVDAATLGLRPADYDATGVADAMNALRGTLADSHRLTTFDIRVSSALLSYIRDLHFGRIDPRAAGMQLEIKREPLDLPDLVADLSRSTDVGAMLQALEPQFLHYELLKEALQHYRLLALQPQLTVLPRLPARALQPGDAYAGAPQLRRLLVAMGDLASASVDAGATLDPALCDGLRAFQLRHGLEPDGVLGPGTWRALTTPFDFRVRQIELTLERWRWLPPSLQAPSIFINIPQFQLFAFPGVEDAAAGMVEMNVVVGATAPSRHTPVFVADLTHLILRPYWDVPRNITVRELLPQIRAHANYLDRNALEIVDGSGRVAPATPANIQGLASGTLRLRQRPGPDNALGLVKFVLPNRFSIYLHDTPARALFARRSRAFSHGCIRLAEPTTLAEFLLRDDAAWTRERLVQAMNGTVPTRIDLPQPVRVFIVYGTALARERGDVLFFDDLYGHDARLAHLLGRR